MRDDWLGFSRSMVYTVFFFFALSVGIMLVGSFIMPCRQQERNILFVRALNLTNLALVPAGRALRAPEMMNTAVDLRFSPLLPSTEPDPAELLLGDRHGAQKGER